MRRPAASHEAQLKLHETVVKRGEGCEGWMMFCRSPEPWRGLQPIASAKAQRVCWAEQVLNGRVGRLRGGSANSFASLDLSDASQRLSPAAMLHRGSCAALLAS
jgi:hypothetical protein